MALIINHVHGDSKHTEDDDEHDEEDDDEEEEGADERDCQEGVGRDVDDDERLYYR